mmetsp:Transcript_46140/g.136350  ORF Transcript_46140/g.136350 Transcript_46140/m.136350 type:complete len:708 (-) Transcript_46140:14-2137(-)
MPAGDAAPMAGATAPEAPSEEDRHVRPMRSSSPGPEVTLDAFEVLDGDAGRSLGKGSFGVVRRIRQKGTDDVYALKTMQKIEVIDGDLIDQVEREIQVQRNLKHENVLRLHRHFEDAETVYLLLEYCAKGELYQLLRTRKGRRFPEPVARHYFTQVVRGLEYLHSQCIVHRDLKPENLLVNHDDVLKIADFGWCALSSVTRTTFCGTLDYLAPEMIQGKGHNHTLDIWSCGVLLYEMVVGRPPFQSTNHVTLISRILSLEMRVPAFVNPDIVDLVRRLLQKEPHERMPLEEVLRHRWVLNYPAGGGVPPGDGQRSVTPNSTATQLVPSDSPLQMHVMAQGVVQPAGTMPVLAMPMPQPVASGQGQTTTTTTTTTTAVADQALLGSRKVGMLASPRGGLVESAPMPMAPQSPTAGMRVVQSGSLALPLTGVSVAQRVPPWASTPTQQARAVNAPGRPQQSPTAPSMVIRQQMSPPQTPSQQQNYRGVMMSSQPFAQTSHMNIAGYPATSSGGATFGGMPRVNSKGAANRTSRREGPPTVDLAANRAPSCGPPERHAAPQPPRPGQVPQLMGGGAITQAAAATPGAQSRAVAVPKVPLNLTASASAAPGPPGQGQPGAARRPSSSAYMVSPGQTGSAAGNSASAVKRNVSPTGYRRSSAQQAPTVPSAMLPGTPAQGHRAVAPMSFQVGHGYGGGHRLAGLARRLAGLH